MKALTLIATLAVALPGCMRSLAPHHPTRTAPLPSRGATYGGLTDLDALPATNAAVVERLVAAGHVAELAYDPREFQARYRSNSRDYGYLDGVEGVNKLRYPGTSHPNAAFSYVQSGVVFEARSQLGPAARLYWAALGLTSRTLASRMQREQLRRLAYAGLARVARRKEQPEWAALLGLCAELARTYAESEQARTQHADFYDELEAQVRTQKAVDAERARARRGMILQGISAGLGAATSIAQASVGGGSPDALAAQLQPHLQTAMEVSRQSHELDEATRTAMAEISGSVGKLREVSVGDVPEIEAGKEFVARQIAWYLAGAAEPGPYIEGPLAQYAARRPALAATLAVARATIAAAPGNGAAGARSRADVITALLPLTQAVLEAERHIASFERFGIVPGPRYLNSVCTPGAGHPVACELAAEAICREGIVSGCAILVALHGEAP